MRILASDWPAIGNQTYRTNCYITDKQRKELFAKINNLAIKINNFISFIRKELKENV